MGSPDLEPKSPEVKYCLIAHHKGTDNYVVSSDRGTLMACGGAFVEHLRTRELLIPFDDVAVNMLAEMKELEADQLIPQGSAQDKLVRKMVGFLEDALIYLGTPPKEEMEFFSLPQEIVDHMHWIPRQA